MNASDEEAHVTITAYFADREPVGPYRLTVPVDQSRVVTFLGISLILTIGLTHMYALPEHFRTAPYLGLSFAVLFVISVVSAINILRGAYTSHQGKAMA